MSGVGGLSALCRHLLLLCSRGSTVESGAAVYFLAAGVVAVTRSSTVVATAVANLTAEGSANWETLSTLQ